MADNTPAVEVTDVTVHARGMVVLDHVSLTIDRGEFTAIIGPNGAGKTTLVKAILGLIKPESGMVKVFGVPTDELGDRRARIGYVPQIFSTDINFPVSVNEVVMMGLYGRIGIGRRPGPQDREAAMKAMDMVGITALKDRPLARLSGGERQRAFVARALANEPELLMLDEPTTGTDVATTYSLYALLKRLKEAGTTIVLVSHDIGVVAAYTDSLICLNRRLVTHCKPTDKECSAAFREMYGQEIAYLEHGEIPRFRVEDH